VRRTGLVLWHKPNSVPAFARWRSFISPGFPSAQLHPAPLSAGPSTPLGSYARPESGAGWGWVRLLPEGFFPHPREKRAGNPPSASSCTTWGFSCGSAYANARWALTPPFHPYPAPSGIIQHGAGWCRVVLGGIFSVTLSVTRDSRPGRPRFHGACCLSVFGLSSGKTSVKPAITRHRGE